jgi:DNA mismatch endonuclease, patch repair protein
MDVLTKEQRKKNMQAIKCKDTKDEILLAKTLWQRGHRYRKNNKAVFGKPDLTFRKYKVAVFVDSEYFHGKDWNTEKHRIKTNRQFWWKKIEGNIQRDLRVNEHLINNGWKVLRFWSKEIRKNLAYCIKEIEQSLKIEYGNIQHHKGKIKYQR